MALKLSENRYLGPRSVPQEVRDLRQSSFDFHDTLGQPVIVKHRWNELDLREGRAQKCPFHDEYYDQDVSNCPYCFGTGYLGGYADGILTYATIADAQEDVFRLTETGLMLHDRSPQITAPWIPLLGDDDLIIVVELDSSGDVADTYDRYTLKQVTPTTMRGPGFKNTTRNNRPFIVSQSSTIDVVPYGSILQDVPITFDYGDVPDPIDPGPPQPVPNGIWTWHDITVRVDGQEDKSHAHAQYDVRVTAESVLPMSQASWGVRLKASPDGTHVYVD